MLCLVLLLIFPLQAATHLFNWIQSLSHRGMTMAVCGVTHHIEAPTAGTAK